MISNFNKNKKYYLLKCDVCGRFIAYNDLHNGKAIHRMITPDSDISFEEFETLCPEHNYYKNKRK